MKYSKPHLTFDQQVQRLIDRGLDVSSLEEARRDLAMIGYYRLSGYWYQWRVRPDGHNEATDTPLDEFVGGHSFNEAISLYSFDRRLRLLLLDAIERLEVAIRVAVAYVVGKHGPMAYQNRSYLGPYCDRQREEGGATNFDKFIHRNRELLDASSERYAEHVRSKYSGEPPIWIAVELWDFGLLSSFYQIMNLGDQIELARHFNVPVYKMMASWLICLNYVRNLCAHHSRLFRRTLVNKPGIKEMRRIADLSNLRELNDQRKSKLYPALCVMLYLMRTAAPGSYWPKALRDHLNEFPKIDGSSLVDYGFPDNWQGEPIWS